MLRGDFPEQFFFVIGPVADASSWSGGDRDFKVDQKPCKCFYSAWMTVYKRRLNQIVQGKPLCNTFLQLLIARSLRFSKQKGGSLPKRLCTGSPTLQVESYTLSFCRDFSSFFPSSCLRTKVFLNQHCGIMTYMRTTFLSAKKTRQQ